LLRLFLGHALRNGAQQHGRTPAGQVLGGQGGGYIDFGAGQAQAE